MRNCRLPTHQKGIATMADAWSAFYLADYIADTWHATLVAGPCLNQEGERRQSEIYSYLD